MDDSTKSTLVAVGVGVGATTVVATAMYFLGGRENPKLPSLGDVKGLAKRELYGAGTMRTQTEPQRSNRTWEAHFSFTIPEGVDVQAVTKEIAHKVINGVMSAGATPHGIDMGVLGTMPQYGTP